MIMRTRNSIVQSFLLALIFILGLSSISWGAEFWLRAETFTKTMPDASFVTMWGFAQCTDGTYSTCDPATVPGPRLTVPAGDTGLTINLRNNLSGPFVEPVSIVIPGQEILPAPVRNPDGRVRSFTTETPPDNATIVTYTFNNIQPGTYLYESGTHPAVQVQMGLYGAVINDAAAGQAYGPATAYDAEVLLLFSEIDPVLHGHVSAGTYGTSAYPSTINYEPKYFLINGDPYSSSAGDIPAGLPGQNLLLRFLSAGLKHRVPAINGLRMSLVAEDGSPYLYPRDQYSLLLSPGKTIDAIVMAAPGGRFPVYDRRLGLKNNELPSGGMLRYLNVGGIILPAGSVVINGGAATTNSLDLTLTLNANSPVNTITNMQFSWDNITWLGWIDYATTANITMPAGPDGTRTIYVQFRDSAGNVSTTYMDSILLDRILPTGSVVINSGAATTNSLAVSLALSATDSANPVTNMQFSWDGITWLGWIAYTTTANATIPAGPDGTKTIYVQFRDAAGNVSLLYSDSILLDTTPPTGTVAINGGAATTNNRNVVLTLSATDVGNAVTSMRFSWDNVTWLGWIAYATTANVTIPIGPDGTKTIYVQFRDAVGNISSTYSDSIDFADVTPPTGSVVINGGAAATNTLPVTLTLSAADLDNAVTDMQFSWDGITWLGWIAYATTANATIPAGPDGTKTIYVQFRDAAGNVSLTYSDSIQLVTSPLTGSVVINSGAVATNSQTVTLTFNATSSVGTVTNRRLSWNNGVTWSGWTAYTPTANSAMPGPDGIKTVSVQFRNSVGNVSATYTDTILLDRVVPTGSVLINGGAVSTVSRNVTLTFSATDTASSVTSMRWSWTTAPWGPWVNYVTTADATITGSFATKTIRVQFRDAAGNVSSTYTDSILFQAGP